MKIVEINAGVVLWEGGDEITETYFPHDRMVSLLAVMVDGRAVETATIGREGAVGVMSGFGLHTTIARAVVQADLVATRISAAALRKAVQEMGGLYQLLIRYNEVLVGQIQMTAGCNVLHPI